MAQPDGETGDIREAFKKKIAETGIDWDAVDYTLPQTWVDGLHELGYKHVVGIFVWLYDKQAKFYGRPFPLTDEAEAILKEIPVRFYGEIWPFRASDKVKREGEHAR